MIISFLSDQLLFTPIGSLNGITSCRPFPTQLTLILLVLLGLLYIERLNYFDMNE